MNSWLSVSEPARALLQSPLFALTLSIGVYRFSGWFYRRSGHFAFFHPVLTGAAIVALLIGALDIEYQRYLDGNALLTFLLGPATVALAIPLYQQLPLIRKMAAPIIISVTTGSIVAAGSAVAIAALLQADQQTLLSLAPKSITTPIAISTAEEIGGLASLATGVVVFTAVLGLCIGPPLLRWLNVTDERVWGLCMGITAHAAGTARSFEFTQTAGTFSGLAMSLTGTFSAVIIPLAAPWIRALAN